MKTPCDVGKSLRATDSFGAETPASQRNALITTSIRIPRSAPLESQMLRYFAKFAFLICIVISLFFYFANSTFPVCQLHFAKL